MLWWIADEERAEPAIAGNNGWRERRTAGKIATLRQGMVLSHRETRLAAADGVRGLACLIVLGVHTSAIVYPATSPYLDGTGKIGVWLFFVLSAFLLTYQLINRGFDAATLADYGMGRALRILPAFAVAVLAYHALGTAGIDGWADVAHAIDMTRAYAHLWTIPVEFKAYAAIPVMAAGLAVISKRFGARGVVLAVAAVIALHQCLLPFTALEENATQALWYLPAFLLGCAAAACLADWRAVSARANLWIAVGVLVGVVAVTPPVRFTVFGIAPSAYLMNKYLFFSAAWTFFVLAAVSGDNLISRILSSRAFSAVGACSFSTYLAHWYIVQKIGHFRPEHLDSAIAAVVLSLGAGALGYALIEHPCEALRRSLRERFFARKREVLVS